MQKDEILARLGPYLRDRTDNHKGEINFEDADKELEIPTGSTKELLTEISGLKEQENWGTGARLIRVVPFIIKS